MKEGRRRAWSRREGAAFGGESGRRGMGEGRGGGLGAEAEYFGEERVIRGEGSERSGFVRDGDKGLEAGAQNLGGRKGHQTRAGAVDVLVREFGGRGRRRGFSGGELRARRRWGLWI